MKKTRPALILLMKLVVSAGLLVFFLTRIHFERFMDTLAAAKFSYVAAALAVYLACQLFTALRWAILARPLGFDAPFKEFGLYCLIGMFFNLFAPSTVGGDVTRIYYLARSGKKNQGEAWAASTIPAAVSVFMDRALGMVVLVWLGAIGLALFPAYAVPTAIRTLTFALAIAFVIGGLLVPFLRRILPEGGHAIIIKLRFALRAYHNEWAVIPWAILLSFLLHLTQAWMHHMMGRALQIDVPFSFCIILYPLVGTFAALPVSLNGIGLREGGYLFLLGVIGITSEKGVAFGLLLFLIVIIDSLVGGILFLLKKSAKPIPNTSQNSGLSQIRAK